MFCYIRGIKMSEAIRVLHVLGGLDIGGAESYVMNMYRVIDKSKVQFDFVKHTSKTQHYDEEILKLGGRIFCCPKYTGKNHFRYQVWWKNFLRQHPELVIIHGHVRSTAAIYLYIAKNMNRLTISHSHSISNGNGLGSFFKNILQIPIRTIADWMFACSEESGKWLFGKNVLTKSNYKMVFNGIDCKKFQFSEEKRTKIRNEFGLSDQFVIGHVGRLCEPKNHYFLIQVFKEICKRDNQAVLLLVGDGPLRDKIATYCLEQGIKENVIFTGSRSDTDYLYCAMDVFLFPSLWEGFPVALLEAQASGLQCFVSDTIPANVFLTNLINVHSLNAQFETWCNDILQHKYSKRSSISNAEAEKINMYDIRSTAAQMSAFYLRQISC